MKRWIVALAGLAWLAACDKKPSWSERVGPGFTVSAPHPATQLPSPSDSPVKTEIYSFFDEGRETWQVQIAEMPAELTPAQILANMTLHFHTAGEVKSEREVAMGEAAKDFRCVSDSARFGKMYVRDLVVIQNHKAYQVIVMHPLGTSEADGDRFVDSFKLTQ